MDNCLPREGPHTGAGEECEEFCPEEEGVSEPMCDELTATPIPRPPVPLGGGGREMQSEVRPRKKGGAGGRCF